MIFTRCSIQDKVCLILVDGGQERNLISSTVVSKLGLQSRLHPAPYTVQLPYEKYPSFVISQVDVKFSIGQYEDQIICDVVYNLPSHIVLGQPWFRNRQIEFVSKRSRKFRLRKRNKTLVLIPLSQEQATNDLKEVRRLQEEHHMALLTTPLQLRSNPARTHDPCFSATKQSADTGLTADDEEEESTHEEAPDTSLEVEGITESREEAPTSTEDARLVPVTRAETPAAPPKQSAPWALVVEPNREDSNPENTSGTLQMYPRISIEGFNGTTQTGLKNLTAELPLLRAKQGMRENESVGITREESNFAAGVEIVTTTPETSEVGSLDMIVADFEESIRPARPLFAKSPADDEPLLRRAIELDLSQIRDAKSFMGIHGMSRMHQFASNMLGLKNPKFEFDNLSLKLADGGNGRRADSKAKMMIRDWKIDPSFNWKPGEELGVDELCWGSSKRKAPIQSNELNNGDGVRRPENSFGHFPVQLFIEGDLFRSQKECPTVLQASKVLKDLEATFEAVIFESKKMIEQPTFDPIWDQFCERFEQRKAKVLRATLFQQGGPDMIPNYQPLTSQLLDKEAIEVGKKKGRIWLCQNPCSGYILWRHGSLNWLGGNSILRVSFADKVTIFPMVCFMDPEDVIKVIFPVLKVATLKLENCQKMAKAENCFVKPTLELNSRIMDGIQVKRLPQHETRYFYVQREGIG
ncbi:unnamed protein product [Linum trigynum]|uniref:Uncharacterized protein n=1 Tax=Linum trigynum TaxID=586398 RepID=A0AAV2FW69_9ROSI